MTEPNYDRLLQLADFLDNDPRVPEHFNMGTWASIGEIETPEMRCFDPWVAVEELGASQHPASGVSYPRCGTVACALGWAAALWPEIAEDSESWTLFGRKVFELTDLHDPSWAELNRDLFYYSLPGDHHVAAERIRNYVKEHRK